MQVRDHTKILSSSTIVFAYVNLEWSVSLWIILTTKIVSDEFHSWDCSPNSREDEAFNSFVWLRILDKSCADGSLTLDVYLADTASETGSRLSWMKTYYPCVDVTRSPGSQQWVDITGSYFLKLTNFASSQGVYIGISSVFKVGCRWTSTLLFVSASHLQDKHSAAFASANFTSVHCMSKHAIFCLMILFVKYVTLQ